MRLYDNEQKRPRARPLERNWTAGCASFAQRVFEHRWHVVWTNTGTFFPAESEEDLLARIMAAAYLGLPGIGDRVYQNMVRGYRVCVDVTGRHIEPFFSVCPPACLLVAKSAGEWDASASPTRFRSDLIIKIVAFIAAVAGLSGATAAIVAMCTSRKNKRILNDKGLDGRS
ncbi:hypothetical protein PR048_002924 [Dryococelus australis]|uniref:Uncharacterized protein n=1 Tax=Dryococelus australis TaxID=614101 RepID=A0ABQ9ILI6_9NEOP|nr:hypothetical protein PR048_002924 [Dryococelus australis]